MQLAIAGKWDEAVKLNRFIIESFGADEETQNRLGKALSELGKLKDAKASYEAALKLNPMNSIAKKSAARINALLHQKEGLKVGGTRVDLNLFVEEMGKTVITTVDSAPKDDICSKVSAGDVEGDGLALMRALPASICRNDSLICSMSRNHRRKCQKLTHCFP